MEAPDAEHVAFALREGRVIFTQDDDYLALHAAGIKHAGIVYCHQESRTLREIIASLTLLWQMYDADELKGRLEFI